MAIQTYSIINNSPTTTATVKYITIATTLTQMQHHLDLTGWNEPFNTSYTDFQGDNTLQSVTKTYVSDVRPINRTYAYHTTTNLLVSGGTVSGISAGWSVSGNSFSTGTTVSATSGTQWIILSAAPITLPPGGETITFTPPAFLLTLNNISGIFEGWNASGAGYSGETVVNTVTGISNTIEMSGYSSSGSPSGSIQFTSAGDNMLVINPLTSSTFKMDYTRNTSAYGTYTSKVFFYILQGTDVVKRVDNLMIVSAAPVSAPSNPVFDGGYEGPPAGDPGAAPSDAPDCTDADAADSSVSCANTAAAATGDTGGDGGSGGGCVISTAFAEKKIWSQQDKFDLINWCKKYLHNTWWGEAFRRGYQVLGSKIVVPNLKRNDSLWSKYATWAFTNGTNLVRGKKFSLISLPNSIVWIIGFMLVGLLVSKEYATKCWTSLYKGKK